MDLEPRGMTLRKDLFEDFKMLRDSDYWLYLSKEKQEGILNLLAGHRGERQEVIPACDSSEPLAQVEEVRQPR